MDTHVPIDDMCQVYKSFPPTWPPFFKALFAANKTLSIIDATVRTPPTMAQVLDDGIMRTLIGCSSIQLTR